MRAELDLQISLLAEHEVTQLMALLDGVARRLGVQVRDDREIQEAKQDVNPIDVLQAIEDRGPRLDGQIDPEPSGTYSATVGAMPKNPDNQQSSKRQDKSSSRSVRADPPAKRAQTAGAAQAVVNEKKALESGEESPA